MSAFSIVKIYPEKQTLILAGEAIPRRHIAIVPGAPTGANRGSSRALTSSVRHTGLEVIARVSSGGFPLSAAHAYARTQVLSTSSARTAIIDIYA